MSDIQFVWEDRPYSIWASRELSKLVGSIEMEKIVLSDVVVTGECSICVTRGKKIGIFELNVRCKWEDEKREKGEITIPELSSVDTMSLDSKALRFLERSEMKYEYEKYDTYICSQSFNREQQCDRETSESPSGVE